MRSDMRGGSHRRSSLRLASAGLSGRGARVGHATGGEQGAEEEDPSVASEADPRRHSERQVRGVRHMLGGVRGG